MSDFDVLGVATQPAVRSHLDASRFIRSRMPVSVQLVSVCARVVFNHRPPSYSYSIMTLKFVPSMRDYAREWRVLASDDMHTNMVKS